MDWNEGNPSPSLLMGNPVSDYLILNGGKRLVKGDLSNKISRIEGVHLLPTWKEVRRSIWKRALFLSVLNGWLAITAYQ